MVTCITENQINNIVTQSHTHAAKLYHAQTCTLKCTQVIKICEMIILLKALTNQVFMPSSSNFLANVYNYLGCKNQNGYSIA